MISDEICAHRAEPNCIYRSADDNFDPDDTWVEERGIHEYKKYKWDPGFACPTNEARLGPYYFPPSEVIQTNYDLRGHSVVKSKSSKTEYQYDGYGNLTQVRSFEDVNDAQPARTTNNLYVDPNLNDWIFGQVCFSETFGGVAFNVGPLKQSFFYYDGSGSTCSVITGNAWLTKEEHIGYHDGVEDSRTWTTYSFTNFGNLEAQTDALNNTTNTYWDSDFPNILPDREVNALGHATRFSYDDYGNLLTIEDPNGVIEHKEYDQLHRLSRIWIDNPTIADEMNTDITVDYDLSMPGMNLVTETEMLDGARSIVTHTYTDGFGLPVLKATEKGRCRGF